MNLTKLFDMQRELDKKIIEEKNLGNMDRLPYLILALQVELGECANEWRGFKYWSSDREPRTERRAYADERKLSYTIIGNPLLEEYVDCLHFILSIALHDEDYNDFYSENYLFDSVTQAFNSVFAEITRLEKDIENWRYVMDSFLGLGKTLGFTWEQIEQAYMGKNAINHKRQTNGY